MQELTEEEIVDRTEMAIREYLSRIRPHGEFILEECISHQIGELKRLFRWRRGLGRRDALTAQDIQDLNAIVSRFLPRIQERARAVQLQYTKAEALWKIRSTAVAEQIKKAFSDAGLKTMVECQRFRAKVTVDLGGHTLRFYIGYKALEKRDVLPDVTQAVLDLSDALGRIGNDVTIRKR